MKFSDERVQLCATHFKFYFVSEGICSDDVSEVTGFSKAATIAVVGIVAAVVVVEVGVVTSSVDVDLSAYEYGSSISGAVLFLFFQQPFSLPSQHLSLSNHHIDS